MRFPGSPRPGLASLVVLAAALAAPLGAQTPAPPAPAPTPAPAKPPAFAMVKVNDDVHFRLGVLLQVQADYLQDTASGGYAQNYFIRRARLMLGGSLAKNVTFLFTTDAPNTLKTVNGVKQGASMIVQDAYVEWKLADAFQLGAGQFRVPLARNNLTSAAALLPVDYGTYTFLFNGPASNIFGNDTGFHARGYLLKGHLEYRTGVFQGQRDSASRNAPRFMSRLNYNVFDTETGYFYSGANFGKKKILAFAAGCDAQKDYKAWAGDVFLDLPVSGGSAVTAQLDYIHYDGGDTYRTLAKQGTFHGEAGVYVASAKLTPYVVYEMKDVSSVDTGDEKRFGGGLAFFRNGHNFNIKAQYTRVDPKVGPSQNQFTVQLQGFYF